MAEQEPTVVENRTAWQSRSNWIRRAVFVVGAVYSIAFLAGVPPWYTFMPVEGTVVEAATGKPMAGVVVVASWEYESGSLGGGDVFLGRTRLDETVTDEQGRFRFDGFTRSNLSLREVRDSDPRLIVFKPRYRYIARYNGGNWGPMRKSYFAEHPFELKTEEVKANTEYQGALGSEVRAVMGRCGWMWIPRMIQAMDKEKRWIMSNDQNYLGGGLFGIKDIQERRECSPSKFFKEYQ